MKVKETERKLFPSLLLRSLTCLGLVGGKETLPPFPCFLLLLSLQLSLRNTKYSKNPWLRTCIYWYSAHSLSTKSVYHFNCSGINKASNSSKGSWMLTHLLRPSVQNLFFLHRVLEKKNLFQNLRINRGDQEPQSHYGSSGGLTCKFHLGIACVESVSVRLVSLQRKTEERDSWVFAAPEMKQEPKNESGSFTYAIFRAVFDGSFLVLCS